MTTALVCGLWFVLHAIEVQQAFFDEGTKTFRVKTEDGLHGDVEKNRVSFKIITQETIKMSFSSV